eukprot:3432412-Amphidinium_carterae.1
MAKGPTCGANLSLCAMFMHLLCVQRFFVCLCLRSGLQTPQTVPQKGHTRLVVPTIDLDAYGIPTPSSPCHLSLGAANCDVTCTTNGFRLMRMRLRFDVRRNSTA